MPKFTGSNDPEEYISWALKVDKIFRSHNYVEERKIAMASLEFQDYVLIWWEQVIECREVRGEPPITTWDKMKDVMRARFVPTYYNRDLFKKLQLLKQGTKIVEEYYMKWKLPRYELMSCKMMSKLWHVSRMDSITLSRRSPTSNHT